MIISGVNVKRDMDLIRAILLAVESCSSGLAPKIEIHDYTQEQINYHVYLLGEAGLAKVHNITPDGGSPAALISSLTWAGHEFLDASRENKIWNLAKDSINKVGGATIQIWTAVLTSLIQKQLGL
jgi:hypothetical protein